MVASLGFGITAARRDGMDRFGREIERLGYASLWANDTQRGSGLATLADAAPGTRELELGVGAIPLSERRPSEIAAELDGLDLPRPRLVVGVGSGASRSLDLVRRGVAQLRGLAPGVRIGVAAVGPKMTRLAGEVGDVVILNWSVPARLAWAAGVVEEAAAAAGRPRPAVVAYVRVALGRGAADRLDDEMASYARHAPQYARAFGEQPAGSIGIALERPDAAALIAALEPYRAVVDAVIVRGLPATDTLDAWLEIARTAAPA